MYLLPLKTGDVYLHEIHFHAHLYLKNFAEFSLLIGMTMVREFIISLLPDVGISSCQKHSQDHNFTASGLECSYPVTSGHSQYEQNLLKCR